MIYLTQCYSISQRQEQIKQQHPQLKIFRGKIFLTNLREEDIFTLSMEKEAVEEWRGRTGNGKVMGSN